MSEKKVTGPLEVKFMATTRPVTNDFTGKKQYVIRGYLDATDPAIAHLRSINEDIVDTKTNRNSSDKSKLLIAFTANANLPDGTPMSPPVGLDLEGNYILSKEGEVINEDCAFINTKYDTATVQVVYKEHAKKGVNLVGFKVLSLTKGERPEQEEGAVSEGSIQKMLNSGV